MICSLRAAEHRGRDGGRGDAHEEDVIEADAVEAVLQREHALDLVGLDHRGRARRAPSSGGLPVACGRAAQIIRDGEDRAEVVGRMAPLGGEPGVVVIEPADQCSRCRTPPVTGSSSKLVPGTRTPPGTLRPRHDRPESFTHAGILQRRASAQPRLSIRQSRAVSYASPAVDAAGRARSRRCATSNGSGSGRWALGAEFMIDARLGRKEITSC